MFAILTPVMDEARKFVTGRMGASESLLTAPWLGATAMWDETLSTEAIENRVQLLVLMESAEAQKCRNTFLPDNIPQLMSCSSRTLCTNAAFSSPPHKPRLVKITNDHTARGVPL